MMRVPITTMTVGSRLPRSARELSVMSQNLSTQALQVAMESPAWEEAIEMLSGTDAWIRLSVCL